MNRITRKLVSLLGIVAVVFTQLAVSAYACPVQSMGIGQSGTVDRVSAANSDGRDADSPALCQKHCDNGQQNVNDAPPPPASDSHAQAAAFIVTLPLDPPAPLTTAALAPSLLRTTSPPLSIRNCCFRI